MALDKRTVKIIRVVGVILLVIGGIIGLVLGLRQPYRYIELEVWPRSDDYNYEQPLIHFRTYDPESWRPWCDKINEFLFAYESTVPEDPPRAPCSVHRQDRQRTSPNCEQTLKAWKPCTAENYYGYNRGRPCIFLRLNNIHSWVPEPYNMTMPLPDDMPNNIKQAMHILANEQSKMDHFPATVPGDYVWVSCDGEWSLDMENIGPIQYIPVNSPPGFPVSRLHPAGQLPQPLVAVYFEKPYIGVVINVECRIWTRDVVYEKTSHVGRVRFQLLVD